MSTDASLLPLAGRRSPCSRPRSAASLAFQVAPEGREARARRSRTRRSSWRRSWPAWWSSRDNRSADGWQSGRALVAGLLPDRGCGTGALVLWDVVGEPRLEPQPAGTSPSCSSSSR